MEVKRMVSRVVVSSPATVANLGPGFDVFGLALSHPADIVEGRISREPGVRVLEITGAGSEKIPKHPELNAVTIAALSAMKLLGRDEGLEFMIRKGIKPGGGIGSSGASAAAGAVVVNELLGGGLSELQLIMAAAKAEERIAGTVHYDNVTPAIVGGFTIVTSTTPFKYIKLNPPPMKVVVALPELELPTRLGRQLLPEKVAIGDAVANVARASAMVAALISGDLKSFGEYMVDNIAEPARAPLVPGFQSVRRAALDAGASGAALAGSGPAVFAIVEIDVDARPVAEAMREAFEREGVACEIIITTPGRGVQVVERGD